MIKVQPVLGFEAELGRLDGLGPDEPDSEDDEGDDTGTDAKGNEVDGHRAPACPRR